MTNLYHKKLEELKKSKCSACGGTGERNDAGLGDMYYNTWECPDCRGEGMVHGETT